MSRCDICPRNCLVDRSTGQIGFCGQGTDIRVARYGLHFFEEPPISGKRGSGTIFFSGCSLRCVFCQNREISRGEDFGKSIGTSELCDIMLELQDRGAHNINLVTPTHFADKIREALLQVKDSGRLKIPIVWNSSGYERVEVLRELEGLVDIYMPDFKYMSVELGAKYSSAADYAEVATEALCEMYRQVGEYSYGDDGMLRRGLLVRHLVLPGERRDSMAVLEHLSKILPAKKILLSVMSQYTPEFAMDCQYKNLHRRVTSFEYSSVVEFSEKLGFEGFVQGRSSATENYTPEFNKEGDILCRKN